MKKISGFSLTELMIAVAIIGILSAVAIPAYTSYLYRSYLSETTAAFGSIKSGQESYFQTFGCYVSATKHPTAVDTARGRKVDWDPAPSASAWSVAPMNVRPDRQVRFNYEVIASNAFTSGGCGVAVARPSTVACATNVSTVLLNAVIFPDNWYVVIARSDFDGDGVMSAYVTAIDDTSVIACNDLE